MTGRRPAITSTRNRRVVELARLHDPRRRRERGLTLVEGPHQLGDAVAAGAELHHVYVAADDAAAASLWESRCPVTPVSRDVLRRIAGTDHPRGPVGVVSERPPVPLTATDTVVLWDVADPGNAGAVCRSAAAFGYAVATTPGTVDPWAPKVVRAASGALFRTTLIRMGDGALDELVAAGLTPLATVTAGGDDPTAIDVKGPVAVLVGNEAHGLPGAVAEMAIPLTIPLGHGVESLNVAVAAGIVLHSLSRRPSPGAGRVHSRR